MIYWRRYGGDYLVSTIGFSMEMDGAYGRLLDNYYEREGPLPLNVEELMEIARATKETDREAVLKVLERKFKKHADGYHHDRADAEIALALQARENGGKHVGKSGKVTRSRTGKPTQTRSGEVTDTATGEITGKVTRKASQTAQESTVQPSTSQPSAVQPSNRPAGGQPPPLEPPRPKRARRAASASTAREPASAPPSGSAPPPEDPDEHPVGASASEIPWWHSWNGISGMALERGVRVIEGQDHPEYVARIFAAVGPGPWDEEQPPDVRERIEYYRATGGNP